MFAMIMILVGYIFGSIPVGYVMARLRGVDLLASGSGHTGTTNVMRSAGLFPATITVLGDAFKGIIPTFVAMIVFADQPLVHALTAVAAVLGHNHSIFLRFKGGVGAITYFGSLAILSLWAALAAIIVGFSALVITKYASMGSFSGAIAGLLALAALSLIPALATIGVPVAYIAYGVLSVLLVSVALRENFVRIKNGTERKIGVKEQKITKVD